MGADIHTELCWDGDNLAITRIIDHPDTILALLDAANDELTRNPHNVRAAYTAGACLYALGRTEEAIQPLQIAAALEDSEWAVLANDLLADLNGQTEHSE